MSGCPWLSHLEFDDNDFEVANELSDVVLSLPIHSYLTEEDVEAVCKVVESYMF